MLKKGMTTIGKVELSLSGLMSSALDVICNWSIVLGILVMVISMASHLVVLSRVDISFAYPFLGLSFVLITIYGHFYLAETVTMWRVIGVLLICSGVAVVART